MVISMEMEIKARVEDFREIIRIIEGMGAKYLKRIRQSDIYFNHPCKDFMKSDEALRIRVSDSTYITYKGPRTEDEIKSRYEVELKVEDGGKAKEILQKLGFSYAGTVVKMRTIYELNGMKISLDSVENLGNFVEIEILGENTEENREKLSQMAKELGLKEYVRETYLEILKNKE